MENGAPGRIRTYYPLVRSQVLYPDELRAHSPGRGRGRRIIWKGPGAVKKAFNVDSHPRPARQWWRWGLQAMTVEQPESEVRRFHGWRLLAVILCVVVVIALVSAVVDWLVIGPLEGRI